MPDESFTARAALLLKSVYPEKEKQLEVLEGLQKILHESSKIPGELKQSRPLTEKTSILITYADMLQASGEPPLHTLAKFLENQWHGVLSHVHLLPLYPWSSDDGFSVKDYYSIAPEYGDWQDVANIKRSFGLMLDAVLNHASAEGEWFQRFLRQEPGWEEAFVTVEGEPDLSGVVRPRALPLWHEFETSAGPRKVWTTFSRDQVDINVRDPKMFLRLLQVLAFYLEKGASFIRLDAIAFLWKEVGTPCIHLPETHAIIQVMRLLTDEIAPGSRLITETNVPHELNISYFGRGEKEASLVYNFALPPLALHTLLSGDTTRLLRWLQNLEYPEGDATYFHFLASHDGIGLNPVRDLLTDAERQQLVNQTIQRGGKIGTKTNPDGSVSPYELNINYLDALIPGEDETGLATGAERLIVAHFLMFSLRGVPGIYFHSMVGSRGDLKNAEESGIPRRINREKLNLETLQAELQNNPVRRQISQALTGMLKIRAERKEFSPTANQEVLPGNSQSLLLQRGESPGILCAANFSDRATTVNLPRMGRYRILWSSSAGVTSPASGVLRLPPRGAVWLESEDGERQTAGS
jgi:glycosidase